jgi:type I restriction enzyme, R subunit
MAGSSQPTAGIVEHDYHNGQQRDRADFPSPESLYARHLAWRGIRDAAAAGVARPFNRDLRNADGTVKRPRYYQATAINRAVEAVLSGRTRLLLTMATGTGKTFVALQVVWKLWESRWPSGRRPRVLYLADRNILIDQPIAREFRPVFGDAVWKVAGSAKTSREPYFALYQSLADSPGSPGIFADYPSDFFDLVVVDECHRGSARDASTWRGILDHFSPAVQLGMTATPLRVDNADTYGYFGNPLYTYSLAQGIDDGFLAPYRVTRVRLSPDAYGWSPEPGQLDRFGREIPDGIYSTADFERVVSLLERTRVAASHLTAHLRSTDRMAKTIVFCVDQEHAEQMRSALHEANSDLTHRFPHYTARIVSDEGDVGREHLDDFTDPEKETPVIVTTSRLLSTGVDIPTCRNIVLFRPIGSMVDFKQIIGRGTRLYPDADKLSFHIIDYTGATALFTDPDFDGVPEFVTDEEIGANGEVRRPMTVAEQQGEYEASHKPLPPVEEVERQASRKFYIDDTEVMLTGESVFVLDRSTGKLRIVEYRDFAADQVRRLYSHVDDLRGRWRTANGRDEVLAQLDAAGIPVGDLSVRLGLPDADPFDLLVHVAWNGALSTRRDRVNCLKVEHRDTLDRHAGEARLILEALLEKYAEHGIEQFDDLASLETPPLSAFGTPLEIAARFGGVDRLRGSIEEIGDLLYAA